MGRSRLGARRPFLVRRIAIAALLVATLQFVASAQGGDGARADETPLPPNTAQTAAQAMTMAQQSGHAVQVVDQLSKTTAVYAMPDGTMQAEIASGPVREPDPSAPTGFAPIDTTLADTGPSVTPAVTDAAMSFSDGGSGPLASLSMGGDAFTEDWLAALPAPTLSGDTATYSDVQPGIDLTLQARATGYEQSWVIEHKPTGPLTLDIPLSLKGLRASVDASGGLVLTDVQGQTKAQADPAQMFDSSADPITGQPEHATTVPTKVVDTPTGWMLEVSPDPSFFDQSGLVWPVTLDPTTDLSVKLDYYVNDAPANRDTSYRTSTILQTGEQDGNTRNRTYMQFYGLGNPPAGSSTHVLSSTLNLWEKNSSATSCTGTWVDVHALTTAMSTDHMTWNTQPSFGSTVYAYAQSGAGSTGCSAGWIHLTDTSAKDSTGNSLGGLVQKFVDGTAAEPWQMAVLALVEDGTTTTWKQFVSFNDGGAHIPTLTVGYNNPPLTPTNLSPASGSTLAPNAVVLHGIYSDPNGAAGHVDYTLTDTTIQQTVFTDAHNAATVTSGSDDPYTVTGLTAGHSYSWTARADDGTDQSPPTAPATFAAMPSPPLDAGASGGSLSWVNTGQVVVSATGGGPTATSYEYRTKAPGGDWSAAIPGSSVTVTAEGETQVQFKALDAYGQASPDWAPAAGDPNGTVRIDRTPPTEPTLSGGSPGWRSAASVTVAASSTDAVSSVDHYNYETSTDGVNWSALAQGSSVTVSAEGETDVRFQVVDLAGNATSWSGSVTDDEIVRLDHTDPSTPTVQGGSDSWTNTPITITGSTTDWGGSGVATYQHETSNDSGTTWSAAVNGDAVTISASAETVVRFQATDGAGHVSPWSSLTPAATARIDLTAPTGLVVTGGSAAWSNAASVTVAATSATDAQSGVAGYEMRTSLDGGETWSAPNSGSSLTVTTEGETLVEFRATDTAGNASAWTPLAGDASGIVRLDHTAPTYPLVSGGSLDWRQGPVAVTASASSDALSGLNGYESRTSTDGGQTWSDPTPGATRNVSAPGETAVQFRSVDAAGNASAWAPAAATADSTVRIESPPTITSTSHPDPTAGYPGTTFDASWTDPAGMTGVQGYAVTLDDNPTTVPSTTLTQATASFHATGQAIGTHYLHVRAEESDGHWSPTATFSFTVLGLLSPDDSGYTTGTVVLQASAPPGGHEVTFQFRRADDFDWSTIPDDRLTADGAAAPQPFQPDSETGDTARITWDAADTSDNDPGVADNTLVGAATDGPIEIRAIMTTQNGTQLETPTNIVMIDRKAPEPLELTTPTAADDTYIAGSTVPVSWAPTAADTDIAGYSVVIDQSAETTAPTTVNTDSATTSADVSSADAGIEYLHIRTVDYAGNWSPTQTTQVTFVWSKITSPADQSSVDGTTPLDLAVQTRDSAPVCWEYSTPANDGWTLIPTADVEDAGNPISGWPLQMPAGGTTDLDWQDFASTSGIDDYPGAIDLRAVALPDASTDCGDPDAVEIGTVSVEYQPTLTAPMQSLLRGTSTSFRTLIADPGPPAENGRIYYSTYTTNPDETTTMNRMTMDADGSEAGSVKLNSGGQSHELGASADGSVVAYGGEQNIEVPCETSFTIDGPGGDQTVQTNGFVKSVAVSPDGSQVAYAANLCDGPNGGFGTSAIFLTSTSNPDGVQTRAHAFRADPANGSTDLDGPTYTPDGQELMWREGDTVQIAPLDASSNLPEGVLYSGPIEDDTWGLPATWNPSLDEVAIPTGNDQITVFAAPDGPQDMIDASATPVATASFPNQTDPVELGPWSPDGTYVLAGVTTGAGGKLLAYDPDTDAQHVLGRSSSASYYPAAWTTLSGDAHALALQYRPHIYFDSSERWMPIDPDALFSEDSLSPGFNQVCGVYEAQHPYRTGATYDTYKTTCGVPAGTSVTEAAGQIGRGVDYPGTLPSDSRYLLDHESLDINGTTSGVGSSYHSPIAGFAECEPTCDPNDGSSRIFYHETAGAEVVYLQYWFFYRFNDSSTLSTGAAYFDQHQGDWEGMTVAVSTTNPAGRVLWVSYSEHRHWYRYLAGDLSKHGVLDGTHPRDYPGSGTHANYPDICDSGCINYDVSIIGLNPQMPGWEASHDGAVPYVNNDDAFCSGACVVDMTGASVDWLGVNWPREWGLAGCSCGTGAALGDAPHGPGTEENQDPYDDPPSDVSDGSPNHWQDYEPPPARGPR